MTAEKSRSKNWKHHHYYSCRWKKWAKHKNYYLRRDEANNEIIKIFSKTKFDKQSLKAINIITENVYKSRIDEQTQKTQLIDRKIIELKTKQSTITNNISNLLQYPDLLEAQNNELQEIKAEIIKLEIEQKDRWQKFWLERFKNSSNKILEHLDKLVLQKENPEVIQLAFDIVFGGKVEYESILSRTPITHELLALNTKKELQWNWNSSLNRKWWSF